MNSRLFVLIRAHSRLAFSALFEFFEGARPILAQQTAQGTVGEQLASSLALGAVVGFIGRITNALDLRSASRTRFPILAVDGHGLVKRRDLFRELITRLGTEKFCPLVQGAANSFEQAACFFMAQALGQGDW